MTPALYREKVAACWVGKAVGGTLGMPHEGKDGPLSLTFYNPLPKGIIPNDDLDLQVLWADRLRATGAVSTSAELFASAWNHHIIFPWDEYGVCKRNLHYGLQGGACGGFDNWFGEGMGAIIRSEIWACLAPADPQRAAAFAWQDASLDHCADGVWAEVLFAALQSAAFAEPDRDRLLDIGLGLLPPESALRKAIQQTRAWWRELRDWEAVRQRIVGAYQTLNFTHVVENLCYIVLGWLAGEGDFGRSICLAVNCGRDTDCTGATLGALLAILDPQSIPAEWKAPISGDLVISAPVVGLRIPKDLEAFTDEVVNLRAQLAQARPVLGPVLAYGPARPGASPIALPVAVSWEDDAGCLYRSYPPLRPDAVETELPGHWSRLRAADFRAPVLVRRYNLHLPNRDLYRIMAWTSSGTAAVWLDGQRLKLGASAPGETVRRGTPSLHRAGSFSALTEKMKPGPHQLVVAVERPAGGAEVDLVVGAAEGNTDLWLPWALARPR